SRNIGAASAASAVSPPRPGRRFVADDPANATGVAPAPSNLTLRVLSSVVLAPIVLAITYAGGAAFAVFWTIVAALVLWEWSRLVTSSAAARPALAGWLAAGL